MMAEGIQVIGLSKGQLHTESVEKKESKDMELFATRGDLLKLQSNLNEHLVTQNEIMKTELKIIQEIVAPLNATLKVSEHMIKINEQGKAT